MLTDANLFASKRQREILQEALSKKVVRVRSLAKQYEVSEMTIRRDLDQLCDLGRLERVHGGARLRERSGEDLSHQLRITQNREAKDAIARTALTLVEDGETIALDASTTCLALARILSSKSVKVITSSLEIANILSGAGVPFILTGGEFNPGTRSFVGRFARETIERLHPDKVFFSAKAFTPETGFTDSNLPEMEIKDALIAVGGTAIALIDFTKFYRRALATIISAQQIDVLITDQTPPEEIRSLFEKADVKILVSDHRQ